MTQTDFEKDKQLLECEFKNANHYFLSAVDNNSARIITLLLSYPDDNNLDPSYQQNYAIRKASEKGYSDIVKLLLDDDRVNPTANCKL